VVTVTKNESQSWQCICLVTSFLTYCIQTKPTLYLRKIHYKLTAPSKPLHLNVLSTLKIVKENLFVLLKNELSKTFTGAFWSLHSWWEFIDSVM